MAALSRAQVHLGHLVLRRVYITTLNEPDYVATLLVLAVTTRLLAASATCRLLTCWLRHNIMSLSYVSAVGAVQAAQTDAGKCTASGACLSKAQAGRPASFHIKAADSFGNRRTSGADSDSLADYTSDWPCDHMQSFAKRGQFFMGLWPHVYVAARVHIPQLPQVKDSSHGSRCLRGGCL